MKKMKKVIAMIMIVAMAFGGMVFGASGEAATIRGAEQRELAHDSKAFRQDHARDRENPA